MIKPPPYIRADTLPKRLEVIKAIYGQGWYIGSYQTIDVAMICLKDMNHIGDYPIVYLDQRDNRFYFRREPIPGYTLVNSPGHLVSYCRANCLPAAFYD